jgi:glyoxylase-like metal-dependent hydrolase (beta-lactamase superfamily II)
VLLADTVLLTGDLLVHAVQLVDPALPYAHDDAPERARESRQAWLNRHEGVLATAHLGEPFLDWPMSAGRP